VILLFFILTLIRAEHISISLHIGLDQIPLYSWTGAKWWLDKGNKQKIKHEK